MRAPRLISPVRRLRRRRLVAVRREYARRDKTFAASPYGPIMPHLHLVISKKDCIGTYAYRFTSLSPIGFSVPKLCLKNICFISQEKWIAQAGERQFGVEYYTMLMIYEVSLVLNFCYGLPTNFIFCRHQRTPLGFNTRRDFKKALHGLFYLGGESQCWHYLKMLISRRWWLGLIYSASAITRDLRFLYYTYSKASLSDKKRRYDLLCILRCKDIMMKRHVLSRHNTFYFLCQTRRAFHNSLFTLLYAFGPLRAWVLQHCHSHFKDGYGFSMHYFIIEYIHVP